MAAGLSVLLGFGQHAALLAGLLVWFLTPEPTKADYPPPPPPGEAAFGGLGHLNYEAGRRLDFISTAGNVFAGVEDFIGADGIGSERAFV